MPDIIDKYVFHGDRLDYSLFKIPETMGGEILTVEGIASPNDEFKPLVEKHGLKGLRLLSHYGPHRIRAAFPWLSGSKLRRRGPGRGAGGTRRSTCTSCAALLRLRGRPLGQRGPRRLQGADPSLYEYVRNDPLNATDPSGAEQFAVGEEGKNKVENFLKENGFKEFYDFKVASGW